MIAAALFDQIHVVRRFNRFYTHRIGALREELLDSSFSLTEGRVLYELGQRGPTTAAELAAELDLDPGYLSRILRGFEDQGLVTRTRSPADARQNVIMLESAGQNAFAMIDQRSQDEIQKILVALTPDDRHCLIEAMCRIEEILKEGGRRAAPLVLRPHQPGDIGWVVSRHAVLYRQEHGFDHRFEALVASIAAEFLQHHDPQRERCWIAEAGGKRAGSAFVMRADDRTAKLRLLLVEPDARGLGIGQHLIEACIRFAVHAGYRTMSLWTNNVLAAARHLYEKAGFRLVGCEQHQAFGPVLIGETWELPLDHALPSA